MNGGTDRYTLDGAGVRDASERIERFLRAQDLAAQETVRLRLTMETLLRRIGERFGRDAACELSLGRRMGRVYIRLDYPGKSFDPTVVGRESEGELWSAQLLTELGLVPEWSWRRGMNRLVLRPRGRGRGVFAVSIGALALAALLGALGGSLPAEWTQCIDGAALSPLIEGLYGLMNAFAPLLLFFSGIALICGAGDTAAFAPTGKRRITRFLARTCFWTLFGAAASAALRGVFPAEWRGAFPTALPGNALTPFLRGDAVYLAVLAAICGAGTLLLGGRAARVREWAEQCASLFAAIMEGLCRLMPLAAFAAVLRGVWRSETESLTALWRPLAWFALCGLAVLLVKLTATAVALRQNPFRLLARIFPPLPDAFLSASSAAAFGVTMDNCENVLRLSHASTLLALPVGSRLCVPYKALCCGAVALFLAGNGGVPVTAAWLAALALLAAVFALVSPAVPGMTAGFYGLLATRLGLPTDGFAAAAILCVLLDPLCAALSSAYVQLELLAQEKRK